MTLREQIAELERLLTAYRSKFTCFSCGVLCTAETENDKCPEGHRPDEWGHEWVTQRTNDLTVALFQANEKVRAIRELEALRGERDEMPLDGDFLQSVGFRNSAIDFECGKLEIYTDSACITIGVSGWNGCNHSIDLPRPATREEFRTLCRVLGIPLTEPPPSTEGTVTQRRTINARTDDLQSARVQPAREL